MNKGITLIVLAAGIGKRMWPLGVNKVLFPFFGSPLFTYTIGDAPEEIARMIIVTNPANNDQIRKFRFPIETSSVIQKEPKGMADAILSARSGIDGPVLIVNADDLVDPTLLSQVVGAADSAKTYGAIAGWKPKTFGPYGYIAFSGSAPTGIVEKPNEGKEPSPYATVVCHYISDGRSFVDVLAKTKSSKDDVYEKALTTLMSAHPFAFVPYDGPLATLKYPWNVLDCMDVMFSGITKYKGKNVTVKSNVTIEGDVHLEDNVVVNENTKIIGPVYIGKNTIIGNNNIIRASHIGANCVTGFSTDITRSYIGDNCWFHSNYIGDSVLEGNISMGGGARLANLRLDDGEVGKSGRTKLGAIVGTGVRIGINASIMPGVCIGKDSFIGSGVVLDRDLAENSFCLVKQELVIRKNNKTAAIRKPLV